MNKEDLPLWVSSLDKESLEFIRRFVLISGSLKELAKFYSVSYPTVRSKLNNLIEKIEYNSNELTNDLEFISLIKNLVIDEKISLDVGKLIINHYKKDKEESKN